MGRGRSNAYDLVLRLTVGTLEPGRRFQHGWQSQESRARRKHLAASGSPGGQKAGQHEKAMEYRRGSFDLAQVSVGLGGRCRCSHEVERRGGAFVLVEEGLDLALDRVLDLIGATVADATRIRALKIYDRHNQSNAIDFINTIIDKFPFRIREVRTDNGHEFQAQFHWHVEDLGIRHAYIKPASPQLNGKVERSHRTDEQEFYQLLTYTDDGDLRARLSEWEQFYNLSRPHGAFNGKAPYEVLRERL